METTLFLAKIIGPVLLVRGVSLLIDRRHFRAMLDGLEREVTTVAFSFIPIALMMAGIAMLLLLDGPASPIAVVCYIIAWGAILKSALLTLFPRAIAAKAKLLGEMGFLYVVVASTLAVGGYLTWFGYFRSSAI